MINSYSVRHNLQQSILAAHLKGLNITPKISWEIAAVIRCAARIDCCKLCLTEK